MQSTLIPTILEPQTELGSFSPIPRGVADYFWAEAQQRRMLETLLLETFRRWGYGDVMTPMFEYADVLSARANRRLGNEMVRFLDRDGSTLALRADMTIPIARLVATRLHDWPMPQRFCYAGSVFRYIEPHAGRQREFTQAGCELIGANNPAADAEILALCATACRAADVREVRLVLGQIQYMGSLLQELRLPPEQEEMLRSAVDRNSAADLERFLRDTPLRTQQRRTLEELPQLSGGDAAAIIDRADRLCLNYAMHAALENLRAVLDHLDAYGFADQVVLDLTEINNLGYYTGLTFELFAPGSGSSLAGGGRYDGLLASFGVTRPAVGFALGIDRLLMVRNAQQGDSGRPRHIAAQMLVNAGRSAQCLALVNQWRDLGVRIAVDLHDRTGPELWEAAQASGIGCAALWRGDDAFCVYRTDAPEATSMSASALGQLVETFILERAGATAMPLPGTPDA